MRGNYLLTTLGMLIACAGILDPRLAQAQTYGQATSPPIAFYGNGYVLLQHGNVLYGFVKPQADRLTIVLDKGNEVTVSNRQVLTVGKSKETLYAYQVRAIRRWGTGEHWHLAQWCIQNGLLDQAIEHYLELEKTAADIPKFKQLDLQLRQALLADAQVQKALIAQGYTDPIESPTADTAEPQPEVVTASVESDADEPVMLAHAFEAKRGARGETMQGPARILPGYVRRSFQTEILPIFVSRCGQSGCHGMLAKNDFQIFQPVGHQAASISERDLESLLRYIDSDDPIRSSIMQYATRPHGSQRNPSIHPNRDEDRVLLEKILRWMQAISPKSMDPSLAVTDQVLSRLNPNTFGGVPASVEPAVALIPKNSIRDTLRRRDDELPEQDRNAKLSKPAKSGPPPVVLNAAELQELEDAILKLEKIESNGQTRRDPFDPAEFNAKYAGNSDAIPKK